MPSDERLIRPLLDSLGRMTGIDASAIDATTPFLDLGADSLGLLQLSQAVQARFGIKVPFRLLIDDLTTVEALAHYLGERLPPEDAAPPPPPAPVPAPIAAMAPVSLPPAAVVPAPPTAVLAPLAPLTDGGIEGILNRQIELLGQQVELLRQLRTAGPVAAVMPAVAPGIMPGVVPAAAPPPPPAPAPAGSRPAREEEEFVPYKPIRRAAGEDLTAGQRAHLAGLIARVNAKTEGSKRLVERDRVHHADSRPVTGFRRLWKDLAYPLVVTDGYGSRIRDIDGNEYVDMTMGFGSLLFGHSPDFLIEALRREVPRGMRLGPQSFLAGDVARLIVELTGVERVTFCNSGTEAIMTALRIARARTGRDKVAMFSGSYHGTADEVLTRAGEAGDAGDTGGRALPLAPGIPASALADMMIFRYDRPQSLAALRRHAHELAAVLIEPPRSRTPDIQPVEFLRELRRITEESGTAFIFDEVVTGFRTHPGGVQALFGIQADLVTYGKAVAGGMPIGIVAGRATFMDTIDGGPWRYGDDSQPEAEMTFYAGTFCKHPYTMAAAKAVLEHLKAAGPALQEGLNRRTDELAGTLNDFFTAEGYPFRVVSFGSLFRFTFPPSLRLGELFYYHLLEHGVYVWEGRNFFLSTAHTDADIAQIVAAVRASAAALRAGGILEPPPPPSPSPSPPRPADLLPLTEAQEQLWILTQLGAESSRAYNESMTLHLRGALDVEALRLALTTVVARHEALRLVLAPDGAGQSLKPPGPVELPVLHLPGGGDRQARIAAWIDAEAAEVFSDLETGPLYRFQLLQVEEGWHLLILTLHHLVTDGFSNAIVLSELGRLYGALARGVTASRAVAELPPPVPFSRHVAAQIAARESPERASAEAYWRARFAVPVPFLELPTDRPRPPLQGHLGARLSRPAGLALTHRVRAFAREQGCTFFVTLLAAFEALLHRLTGQPDLVVGTPAAGQMAAGGGNLVGYCVNLLPLRSQPRQETTVAAHLKGVRAAVLDAFEHQAYPFQRLLKQLDLPRDPSRLPLVAAAFTTERGTEIRFPGLEAELASNDNGGAKFELFLTVVESDDGMLFDCEHNTYLFSSVTIARWLGHLGELLQAMSEAPAAALSQLPMLCPAERHQMLAEWNDTAVPAKGEVLVHQLFEAQAACTPDAPAVDFADRRLTYGELNVAANRWAHHLAGLGIERGRPVAILLSRSLALVPVLLGVLKAGGAYVPLDPADPVERIRGILATLEVTVVITEGSWRETLAGLAPRLPALSHVIDLADGAERLPVLPETNLPARATAADVAYVIFTSGSTGTPKGVVETHRPVVNLIRWVNRTFGVGPADRVLFLTALTFDLSVYDLFGLLAAGGSIRLAAEADLRDPERLLAWLVTDGITFWDSAPAALQQLVPFFAGARPAGDRPRLRLVFQSGDWIPLGLPGQVREAFPGARVVALGGATEATVWSNFHRVEEIAPQWSSIPYGRPIANARYYVLDGELAPVPLGVAGDLFIGGSCLSSGYAGAPWETARQYLPDPFTADPGGILYRTGDRARYLPDGEIEFLGRLDSQVKVRGFRVELGEIEAVLARHPALLTAAVAARGDARGEKRLVAYLVPRSAEPAVEELRAYLKERLPEHMVPATFVALPALPVTANGKLDRRALPAPDFDRPTLAVGFAPPATPLEERLAVIFRQALGVERIGRDDDFFALGGDSILAVRIVAQARRAGLSLSPADLFQSPTLAELAALATLAELAAAGAAGGEVALTPIQRWFFARALPLAEHYNQAVLLVVPAELSAALVERAFDPLVRRHEALRMRYERGAAGWRQLAAAPEAARVACEEIDLTAVAGERRAAAVTAACARLQAGLDLERGPLVRLALLRLAAGEPQRLALVIHHLAVDLLSWPILLAELATACEQLLRGGAVELAPPTTALGEWGAKLASYARSVEVERQIPLWCAAARQAVRPLPRDFAGEDNTVVTARHVEVELDAAETRVLLREMPRVFRTLTPEILLAALARALGAWTGQREQLVDVEGNGREVDLAGVNLARTVGWFTTLYPALLELPPEGSPRVDLSAVREQLRGIPQEGLGYGLLRYGDRPEVAKRLAALPPAEVSFLYAGGLGEAAREASGFSPAAESPGPDLAPANPRSHLIEVQATVAGERLRTVFTYGENVHRRATVERLAADFLARLRALLAAAGEPVSEPPTPADFPQADLTQDELDALFVQFQGGEGGEE